METEERSCKWTNTWILPIFIGLLIYSGKTDGQLSDEKFKNVTITNLVVPHSVENGTKEYIILDCEYKLRDNNTNILVVNWIWNDVKIIYTWIPEAQSRKSFGFLNKRMDMNYSPSDVPWEKYRALKISNPTTDVSGKYTCDISTSAGHASESSELIVYSKPKEYELKVNSDVGENQINVTCWALGGYPKPNISLSYEVDRNRIRITSIEEQYTRKSGAYDVWVYSTLNTDDLPSSTKIICDIKIPNTAYLVRKEVAVTGSRSRQVSTDGSNGNSRFKIQELSFIVFIIKTIHHLMQ